MVDLEEMISLTKCTRNDCFERTRHHQLELFRNLRLTFQSLVGVSSAEVFPTAMSSVIVTVILLVSLCRTVTVQYRIIPSSIWVGYEIMVAFQGTALIAIPLVQSLVAENLRATRANVLFPELKSWEKR